MKGKGTHTFLDLHGRDNSGKILQEEYIGAKHRFEQIHISHNSMRRNFTARLSSHDQRFTAQVVNSFDIQSNKSTENKTLTNKQTNTQLSRLTKILLNR